MLLTKADESGKGRQDKPGADGYNPAWISNEVA